MWSQNGCLYKTTCSCKIKQLLLGYWYMTAVHLMWLYFKHFSFLLDEKKSLRTFKVPLVHIKRNSCCTRLQMHYVLSDELVSSCDVCSKPCFIRLCKCLWVHVGVHICPKKTRVSVFFIWSTRFWLWGIAPGTPRPSERPEQANRKTKNRPYSYGRNMYFKYLNPHWVILTRTMQCYLWNVTV